MSTPKLELASGTERAGEPLSVQLQGIKASMDAGNVPTIEELTAMQAITSGVHLNGDDTYQGPNGEALVTDDAEAALRATDPDTWRLNREQQDKYRAFLNSIPSDLAQDGSVAKAKSDVEARLALNTRLENQQRQEESQALNEELASVRADAYNSALAETEHEAAKQTPAGGTSLERHFAKEAAANEARRKATEAARQAVIERRQLIEENGGVTELKVLKEKEAAEAPRKAFQAHVGVGVKNDNATESSRQIPEWAAVEYDPKTDGSYTGWLRKTPAERKAQRAQTTDQVATDEEISSPTGDELLKLFDDAHAAALGNDLEAAQKANAKLDAVLRRLPHTAEASDVQSATQALVEQATVQPTGENESVKNEGFKAEDLRDLEDQAYEHARIARDAGDMKTFNEAIEAGRLAIEGQANAEYWGSTSGLFRSLEVQQAINDFERSLDVSDRDLELPDGVDKEKLIGELKRELKRVADLAVDADDKGDKETHQKAYQEAMRLFGLQDELLGEDWTEEDRRTAENTLLEYMGYNLRPENTRNSQEVEPTEGKRARFINGLRNKVGQAIGIVLNPIDTARSVIEWVDGHENWSPTRRRVTKGVGALCIAGVTAAGAGLIFKATKEVNNNIFDSGDNFDNLVRHGLTPDQAHATLNNPAPFERAFRSPESVERFGRFLEWVKDQHASGLNNKEILSNLSRLPKS